MDVPIAQKINTKIFGGFEFVKNLSWKELGL